MHACIADAHRHLRIEIEIESQFSATASSPESRIQMAARDLTLTPSVITLPPRAQIRYALWHLALRGASAPALAAFSLLPSSIHHFRHRVQNPQLPAPALLHARNTRPANA